MGSMLRLMTPPASGHLPAKLGRFAALYWIAALC